MKRFCILLSAMLLLTGCGESMDTPGVSLEAETPSTEVVSEPAIEESESDSVISQKEFDDAPKLEDFDNDFDKFYDAILSYCVQKSIKKSDITMYRTRRLICNNFDQCTDENIYDSSDPLGYTARSYSDVIYPGSYVYNNAQYDNFSVVTVLRDNTLYTIVATLDDDDHSRYVKMFAFEQGQVEDFIVEGGESDE